MIIELASVENAEEILVLQKLAYSIEARLYPGIELPPLSETLQGLKANFKNHLFLKATVDSKIVGSVRAYRKDDTCYVGRLMVHPDFQNRGIAKQLLKEIERMCTQCDRFELFTGSRSKKNIHLYEKLGYKQFRTEKVEENLSLIFFEKLKQPIHK